ncbi:MAG: MFS transporter [Rhodospirillaceae bacterium]
MLRRLLSGPVARLLIVTAIAVMCALGTVSFIAVEVNEQTLMPELAGKAELQADSARSRIDRALELGIPLDKLAGFEAFADTVRKNDPDLLFMALTDAGGRILMSYGLPEPEIARQLALPTQAVTSGSMAAEFGEAAPATLDTAAPLYSALQGDLLAAFARVGISETFPDGEGVLVVAYDRAALLAPVAENLEDIGIVLIVCLFLSFELMILVLTVNLVLPIRTATQVLKEIAQRHFTKLHGQITRDDLGRFARHLNEQVRRASRTTPQETPKPTREPKLIAVRLLAFLFVFAEELARPFMPVFFGSFTEGTGIAPELSAGLIMTLHTAMIALVMPIGSLLYERVGRRRMYALGAILATIGLVGTGYAVELWDLLLWRAISGAGYALAFVACQGYVLESTGSHNRTQGAAMFVGGIMLADICGPAIGGIIADRIGYSETFLVGASMAALSGLLVMKLMDPLTDHREAPPKLTRATFIDTLSNRRFLALLFLAAVPSKMLLTGFLFFLVPLALVDMNTSESEIGRVVMIYGILAVVLGPFFAKITDKIRSHGATVGVGCLIAAGGVLPASQGAEPIAILLGVAALGIGQAMSISAQVSTAVAMSEDVIAKHGQGPVMAVLRLVERLGGSIGPLAVAAIAAHSSLYTAIGVLGVYCLASAALFMLVVMIDEATKMAEENRLLQRMANSAGSSASITPSKNPGEGPLG